MIVVLLGVPAHALAQGGPPLITDDPDTPGPGYWEINVASVFEKTPSERRRELPLADINYGIGTRIQLKFEFPWVTAHKTAETAHTGAGNSLVGVKWRFLGQEGRRIAWATYPQLEIATGRSMADRGFVDDGMRFLLPTELTLQIGHVEINGEAGRNFVENGPGEWIWGVATEFELPRVELLGELSGNRTDGSATGLTVNIGARPKITQQMVLLAAAGTSVRGPSDDRLHLRVYLGIQFKLPRQFMFDPLNQQSRRRDLGQRCCAAISSHRGRTPLGPVRK